jgi:HNH endonuclease
LDDFYCSEKVNKNNEIYLYYKPYCKECEKQKNANWRKNNPEKRKESLKKDNAKPRKRNLMRVLNKKRREEGKYREWQQNNKDKSIQYRINRGNKHHTISKEEWIFCKEYFNNECAYCGLHISEHFNLYAGELKWTDFHKEHVDHKGSNGIENCVPSCKSCNSSKHTYKVTDWYNDKNSNFTLERSIKISNWLKNDVIKICK